jgi:hypothetical protein
LVNAVAKAVANRNEADRNMNQINYVTQQIQRLFYPFTWENLRMGQDVRGRLKAERAYYQSNPLQRCIVCGKQFIRRKDKVCSRDCLEKVKASENLSENPGQ